MERNPMEAVPLRAEQVPAAGEMLARAFWDDSFSRYVLPDDGHRARALVPWFTVGTRVGQLAGQSYTTPGPVEGAAVWIPPGVEFADDQFRAAGAGELHAVMGPEARARFEALISH